MRKAIGGPDANDLINTKYLMTVSENLDPRSDEGVKEWGATSSLP